MRAARPQKSTFVKARDQRRFFVLGGGGVDLPLQKSIICLVASAWIDAACRFAAAAAWPRAEPITLLAELSQTLMNGFFVVHGLRMSSSIRPPRPLPRIMRDSEIAVTY
jgi:hypothetical protein